MIIDINEYEKINERKSFIKTYLISVMIILMLIIFIIYLFYEKKIIYHENMIINDNNNLYTILNKEDFDKLCTSKKITINDELYNFDIEEAIFNNTDFGAYYETRINVEGIRILENTNFRIKMREESLFNYIKEIIGGKL